VAVHAAKHLIQTCKQWRWRKVARVRSHNMRHPIRIVTATRLPLKRPLVHPKHQPSRRFCLRAEGSILLGIPNVDFVLSQLQDLDHISSTPRSRRIPGLHHRAHTPNLRPHCCAAISPTLRTPKPEHRDSTSLQLALVVSLRRHVQGREERQERYQGLHISPGQSPKW